MLRRIKRSQDSSPHRVGLPIMAFMMKYLQLAWTQAPPNQQFEATMIWAAACLGYFGFMGAGESTSADPNDLPAILVSDVVVDSHTNPSMLRILLCQAKIDPYGKGVVICVGRTNSTLCPVAALLGCLTVCPAGEGPLFIFIDGPPLKRDRFVREVRAALASVHIDHKGYSRHRSPIGEDTMAAQAGMPEQKIKILGR